ncbi:DUF2283 domain-containing protein [Kamptonema cortianum]|uniref:DUF2283 domain-containing protein n=1 Tax=Geitlerinema calcuttense NRMC-F 0142 TaxID=2922238 RepID=A0ABT7LYB1_9CYAN|nr:DUF2283 domain-containing protein [Geitlerinema calcuttense]MDK3155450.1 DUF2283 domain-containing protein [Kamptonema cortianum]MDL5056789.1 DUF2283 domain-containing protein [Geitlerinema calcuttense NRMC-F 0142]
MKINYGPDVDILSIVFNDTPVEGGDEEKPALILDHDREGNVVGLEILDASKKMANPRSVEYSISA